MTLEQVNTYLAACRGSIPASLFALRAAKNFISEIVLECAVFITLVPFLSALLIGYAYQRQIITIAFQIHYQPGGDIGLEFTQTIPPMSIRARPASLWPSWTSVLTPEPLPEYREWFVDRSNLTHQGNMSVETRCFILVNLLGLKVSRRNLVLPRMAYGVFRVLTMQIARREDRSCLSEARPRYSDRPRQEKHFRVRVGVAVNAMMI